MPLCRHRELNALRAEPALAGNADFEHFSTLPGIGSVIALIIIGLSHLVRFRRHRKPVDVV